METNPVINKVEEGEANSARGGHLPSETQHKLHKDTVHKTRGVG